MEAYKKFVLIFLLSASGMQAQNLRPTAMVSCNNIGVDTTYVFTLDTVGTWSNVGLCGSISSISGEEIVMRVTAPCTNTFKLKIAHLCDSYVYPVGIRVSTGSCTPGGFTCLSPYSEVLNGNGAYECYYNLVFDSATTYDILIDYKYASSCFPTWNISFIIQSPHPENIHLKNITPDSLSLGWSGTFDEVFVEYGPKGFVPGSDTVAGINGVIISSFDSMVTVYNLPMDSVYDFYVRNRCGQNFGSNSGRYRIKIPQPDSLISVYAGCSAPGFSYTSYGAYPDWTGSYTMVSCGGSCLPSAPEKIIKFIPDTSGIYILNKNFTGTASYFYHLHYKLASLGMDEQNWICIGTATQNIPWSHAFGPLIADTSYYIMVHSTQDNNGCSSGGILTSYYNLTCPGVCPFNAGSSIINIGYTQATVTLRAGNTLGYHLIEYGLEGYVPGMDSLPGIGGTIISAPNVYYNYPITSLLPGTGYDVYIRQFCNVTGSFSANSGPMNFRTQQYCSSKSDSIISNASGNSVCFGNSVQLTQIGGILSPIGTFKWYTDSCGGNFIGSGNSISVSPDSTTTYFVRPEDTCSVLSCASITLTVDSLPVIQVLNPPVNNICLGDTVVLNAFYDSTFNYQWKRYGQNIPNANADSLLASLPGGYKVEVANQSGCTAISSEVIINIICLPIPDPVERLQLDTTNINQSLLIIPNPNSGNFDCIFPGLPEKGTLRIFNSLGMEVYSDILKQESKVQSIDVSKYGKGIYNLRIDCGEKITYFKSFVVE